MHARTPGSAGKTVRPDESASFDASGSKRAAGAWTVAVFTRSHRASAVVTASTVKVAVAPGARSTSATSGPAPPAVLRQAAAGEQVQEMISRPWGGVSRTTAPTAGSGPPLVTSSVIVTGSPAVTRAGAIVLRMERSASGGGGSQEQASLSVSSAPSKPSTRATLVSIPSSPHALTAPVAV